MSVMRSPSLDSTRGDVLKDEIDGLQIVHVGIWAGHYAQDESFEQAGQGAEYIYDQDDGDSPGLWK